MVLYAAATEFGAPDLPVAVLLFAVIGMITFYFYRLYRKNSKK